MQDDDLLKQNQAAEGKTSSTEGRLEQDQLRSKYYQERSYEHGRANSKCLL